MRRYLASGINHHWTIDPRARTLEAYRLGKDGYQSMVSLDQDDLFEPEIFPGITINIVNLWR